MILFLPNFIYYCHKVKHIPFDNNTKVLETVRTETFERYQQFIVVDNKAEYQRFDKEKPWNLWLVYRLETPYKNYP